MLIPFRLYVSYANLANIDFKYLPDGDHVYAIMKSVNRATNYHFKDVTTLPILGYNSKLFSFFSFHHRGAKNYIDVQERNITSERYKIFQTPSFIEREKTSFFIPLACPLKSHLV